MPVFNVILPSKYYILVKLKLEIKIFPLSKQVVLLDALKTSFSAHFTLITL